MSTTIITHCDGCNNIILELKQRIAELEEVNIELNRWIDDCQSGMYINCVYCGHRYGPDDSEDPGEHLVTMRTALEQHISVCPKHPLSTAKRRIKLLEKSLKEICEQLSIIEGNISYTGHIEKLANAYKLLEQ